MKVVVYVGDVFSLKLLRIKQALVGDMIFLTPQGDTSDIVLLAPRYVKILVPTLPQCKIFAILVIRGSVGANLAYQHVGLGPPTILLQLQGGSMLCNILFSNDCGDCGPY